MREKARGWLPRVVAVPSTRSSRRGEEAGRQAVGGEGGPNEPPKKRCRGKAEREKKKARTIPGA